MFHARSLRLISDSVSVAVQRSIQLQDDMILENIPNANITEVTFELSIFYDPDYTIDTAPVKNVLVLLTEKSWGDCAEIGLTSEALTQLDNVIQLTLGRPLGILE
ncbi:hypothetical protein RB195_003705 [Necator americanus]|uniref:Uncharacterized protein n=1 Tax=Necator americanus TaxID=51031 RepID=A0ABR1DPR4_NECAM